jgi:riboflavin biosynthesis pyrimidine reductase
LQRVRVCTMRTGKSVSVLPTDRRRLQALIKDRNAAQKHVWRANRRFSIVSPAEIEWACFAAWTPHYVLSSPLTSALWPRTSFVRGLEEIAALKQQPGIDIYLIGGARITAIFIDAGREDELRLIVYPLIAGEGKALFATRERRRGLELRKVQQLPDGRVSFDLRNRLGAG